MSEHTPFLEGHLTMLRALNEGDLDGPMSQWSNDREVTRMLYRGAFPENRATAAAAIVQSKERSSSETVRPPKSSTARAGAKQRRIDDRQESTVTVKIKKSQKRGPGVVVYLEEDTATLLVGQKVHPRNALCGHHIAELLMFVGRPLRAECRPP